MRGRRRSTRSYVAGALVALAPSGCVATKAWMHGAEEARGDPIALVGVSATAREGGRIVHVRLEDETGEVSWYRVYAGHAPVLIDEDDVGPGDPAPIEPWSVRPVSTGTAVIVDLPSLPAHLLQVRFSDGRATTLELPGRYRAALSTFMYSLTPFVALGERPSRRSSSRLTSSCSC